MSDPYVIFVPLDATPEQLDAITPPEQFAPVAEVTRNERLDICKGCDRLFAPTLTCKECFCFMGVKTWIPSAHCALPEGERKW